MTQQDIEAITEIIRDTHKQLSDQILEFQEQNNAKFERNEAQFDRLEAAQLETDKKVDRVLDHLDGLAKRITDDDEERVALSAQVDRHEDWITQAAPATGIKYVPGA